jgi:dephospho-CoA kinase
MIIGLTGYAQSGKDTVASLLVEHYGYTRIAFADKIRELLYEMDPPIPVSIHGKNHVLGLQNFIDTYGWDVGKQNTIVRAMLQNLGVGARKVFGNTFWVQQALCQVHFEGNYVITDVRFINESEAIRKYDNANIWRVVRSGVGPVNSHISESELDSIAVDYVINNDGDFKDLMVEIQSAYDL